METTSQSGFVTDAEVSGTTVYEESAYHGPTTESRGVVPSRYERWGKRSLDVVVGMLLFVGLLPVMAVTALVVLVTSGWPIFYRSERLGRDGRPFRMLKFRTMVTDADEALRELLSRNEALAAEYWKSLKLRDDPRRTRMGVILRKFSIDELPQFWHVIKGEMSLVGPRPYLVNEKALVEPSGRILNVTPGVTGPWQVRGRNELSAGERIALDIEYVSNIRLAEDLTYLVATLRCLVSPNGR